MSLRREGSEILLAGLKRLSLLIGGALKIHAKPKNRNEDPSDASRNILCSFQALFACELPRGIVVSPTGIGRDGNQRGGSISARAAISRRLPASRAAAW
jgi:hypothetical protein